jgi:hypothetical protein
MVKKIKIIKIVIYLFYKDEKENISNYLQEIAGRGKAESSNTNVLFSSMYHTLFFSRFQ